MSVYDDEKYLFGEDQERYEKNQDWYDYDPYAGYSGSSTNITNKTTTDSPSSTNLASPRPKLSSYSISNYTDGVNVSGTSGDDSILNVASKVTIDGGAGSDVIRLETASNTSHVNVSVNGGTGNDIIENYGSDKAVLVGGDGNDLIDNWGQSTTIQGGTGNDSISLGANGAVNCVVQYVAGDGNDSIAGFAATSTLSISGDNYSTATSGSDMIVTVGNGKITLVGAGGTSPNIRGTYGSSTVQAATSVNTAPAATTTATAPAATTTTSTPIVSSNYVYAGGDQIISDYTSGEKIVLGTMPTGWIFGGGNFALGSATGNLFIANANDKLIDFTDAAGNSFLKAYAATNAGVIDGRGLAGYEYITGSDFGGDAIYAGDGGSQLWGGNGFDADVLTGGGGTDIFTGGKYQGADVFANASSADVVNLNDATLSDIVAAGESNNVISLAFNTGNVVAVGSSELISAAFVLADGSAWRYNHVTKSWQGA